jgi:hypothetical protein
MAVIRKVETVWTGLAGAPHLSTMFFTYVIGNATAVINAVDQFWTDLAAQIDNGLAWTVQAETQLIEDTSGLLVGTEGGVANTGNGLGVGNALPPATQGLVNWRTNTFINGRTLRGKTYVPGPVAATGDINGHATAAYQTALNTAGQTLITGTSGPGPLRVFSRTHLTSATVQSAVAFTDFAVLRSRRQ